MPIIASAKKRNKQNEVSRVRNHANLSKMRSYLKNITKWSASGDSTDAEKARGIFNEAQKAIDMCQKKNLIHKRNAARKKSRIARMISSLPRENNTKAEEEKREKQKEEETVA